MQEIIYTIDQNQLGRLIRRLLIAMFRRMTMIVLSVAILQYLSVGRHEFKVFFISTIIIAPVAIFLPQITLRKKLRRMHETFKIVLNDDGVEVKAEGMPYRTINWNNLIVKEQESGIIDLYDNSISKFSRKWSGKGWIRIQPEICNRDVLLNELTKKVQ